MNKPLVLARQDFIDDIVSLINNSQLPMFAVYDVLNDVQKEVKIKAREQYEEAKDIYEKALKSEGNNEDGSD